MNTSLFTFHHGDLLKEYITKNKINRKGGLQKIADTLGLTRQGLYALYQQPEIKEKHRDTLINYLELPEDFFPKNLSGEHSKDLIIELQNKCIRLQQQLLDKGSYRPKLHPIIIDTANNDKIALVPKKAIAGYVKNYFEPEYIAKLQTFSLPNFGTGFAFEIEGDSMNRSDLFNADFALCNELVESLQHINPNTVYIVIFKSGDMVCKKIALQGNEVSLISSNPDYEPYNVNTSELEQIWKVKGKYTSNIYSV